MKKLLTLAALALLLTAAHTHAQTTTPNARQGKPPAGPRDLYTAYGSAASATKTNGRPGAKVRVELERDGRARMVSPQTTFRAGDKVRFHFAMNFSGYVVIINEGSSGKRTMLFPSEGVSNRIGKTRNFTVPQGDAWFQFDETPGEERLTFIMSKREIQEVIQLTTASPNGTKTSVPTTAPAQSSTTDDDTDSSSASASSAAASNTPTATATQAATAPAAAPLTEEQQILADLNSRALAGGRDLNVVVDNNEGYVLASDESLAKPVGFKLTLKHR